MDAKVIQDDSHELFQEKLLLFKRHCPTRWSSRYDCLLYVKVNYTNLLHCLSKIILVSTKRAEIVEVIGLRNQMTSFNFVLIHVFQCKIMEQVNFTSKTAIYHLMKQWMSFKEVCSSWWKCKIHLVKQWKRLKNSQNLEYQGYERMK